jgi:1-deoxy-D-xylulose-5-phosphate reductoisomerase
MEKVIILGSTGSIGNSALDVIRSNPDRYKVIGLCARKSSIQLAEQARFFGVEDIAITDETTDAGEKHIIKGRDAAINLIRKLSPDIVVNGISGAAGFLPTLEALKKGVKLALANKESLVVGGKFVKAAAKKYGAKIIPVDSEHSAIFQCLQGERKEDVEKIILTASGGPFKDRPRETFASVTPEEALKHPTWNMGPRITIDSATMVNKALEIIEASWLFDMPGEKIDVWIHPASIVHSIVQFRDSSFKAQVGIPDMRVPIAYALSWPERLLLDLPRFDFHDMMSLEFSKPEEGKFRALRLAHDALKKPDTLPCVMNAADEVAVDEFLKRNLSFDRIPIIIERTMDKLSGEKADTIEELIELDRKSRITAKEMI